MEAPAAGDELGSTPEPTIVQPAGATAPPPYPARDAQPGEQPPLGESAQFSEELEDRGLLESSTRLKPHEAQSYRKKALWVSWASIVVTLALAVAAFRDLIVEGQMKKQISLLVLFIFLTIKEWIDINSVMKCDQP
uniref:Uncharacterized protein n=1 Tax=Sphaerodactylus townsendi TaxID=933632 RepID=A0ACB8G179_9SAUR